MRIPFLSGKKKQQQAPAPTAQSQPVYITKPPKVKKVKQPIMSSFEKSRERQKEYRKRLDNY